MSTRILYVEDEPFLGKIVKESLESRGFDVHMLADGAEVMPMYEQVKPDICVLDIMLPNKDGYTLGREIRALSPQVPIIYLTAKAQTEDLKRGFEAGGNDYIKKPFSMEELIVRIHNLLNLTRQNAVLEVEAKVERICLGQYTFWPQRYELQRGDEVRKLSHREAQLLQILAHHQNQAVERKRILQEVWGDDSIFNSRNLDVYVNKLRKYLKDDPQLQLITLKGVGYHFVVGA